MVRNKARIAAYQSRTPRMNLSTKDKRMSRLSLLPILMITVAGCGSELGARTIDLDISYYEESDYGDTDATGTVQIDTATGRVDVSIIDLDMLDGEVYEGWLAGGGESPISTGRFNTDADGNGSSTIALGDITLRTYARFLLTVEPEPDSDPGPDSRHNIGAEIPELPVEE